MKTFHFGTPVAADDLSRKDLLHNRTMTLIGCIPDARLFHRTLPEVPLAAAVAATRVGPLVVIALELDHMASARRWHWKGLPEQVDHIVYDLEHVLKPEEVHFTYKDAVLVMRDGAQDLDAAAIALTEQGLTTLRGTLERLLSDNVGLHSTELSQ